MNKKALSTLVPEELVIVRRNDVVVVLEEMSQALLFCGTQILVKIVCLCASECNRVVVVEEMREGESLRRALRVGDDTYTTAITIVVYTSGANATMRAMLMSLTFVEQTREPTRLHSCQHYTNPPWQLYRWGRRRSRP